MTSLLKLPLKAVGLAADAAVTSVRLAGAVAEHVTGRRRSGTQSPGPPAYRAPDTPPRPAAHRPAPAGSTAPGPSVAPMAPPDEASEGAVTPAAGAGPVIVEPSAVNGPQIVARDPVGPSGADAARMRQDRREADRTEDSPGPQIRIDEPWPGYGQMTAPDIVDRLTGSDVAQRAVVALYERAHRARKTVLEAAREP